MSAGEYIAGRELSDDLELSADVVVVGSGASGSVVASKLAAAGKSVIVVEEGPRVKATDYAKWRPTESLQNIWREGGTTAAVGLGDAPVINVTMGRCVGGSSVLTGGVCFRTPEYVLDEWVNDHGMADFEVDRMARFFEEVEEVVHVETVPEAMRSKSTTLFVDGALKRGLDIKPTRRNTKDCVGNAQCNFGCPVGAKLSVDVSYLPRAVASGTTVISDFMVDRVMRKGRKATGVVGHLLDPDGRPRQKAVVHAEKVVLAAGAAHTPLILWRSGINLKHVGRNLTLHPGFRVIARFDESVRGWAGALQSAFSDSFEDEGFTLMSVFVPPFAVAGGVPGFGADFTERVAHLDKLAMFGGLIHDDGGGRIRRNPFGREPIITYRMTKRDRALIPRVISEIAETYLAAGARELYLPVIGHDPVDADGFRKLDLSKYRATRFECSSQHPLGTTRMGTSSQNSVVDERGAVWDADGLYVVDGGTFPTSLGVNPQLSVMALAARFAERILD